MIPCLNRDGDLLSDLVLPLFGSIAGAESVLLALDDELRAAVAMAEAPHGTAPALQGKDIANPMGMILAARRAAPLRRRGRHEEAERASRAIYEAVLEAAAAGVRTPDLGGHAGTTEFTDAVIERVPGSDDRALSRRRVLAGGDDAAPLGDQPVANHEGGLGGLPHALAALAGAGTLGELEGGDREPVGGHRLGQRRAAGQRLVEASISSRVVRRRAGVPFWTTLGIAKRLLAAATSPARSSSAQPLIT